MTKADRQPCQPAGLELRYRAIELQRRRFWREVTFGAITLIADVLALSVVFALLAMVPISEAVGGLGEDGQAFVRGLIPHTTIALARRVTLLVFSLFVTRSYAHTERSHHAGRIFAALLLGLVLPRWADVFTSNLPARWILLATVLGLSWSALVVQRKILERALGSLDPRRHDPERTLVVGPAGDVADVVAERTRDGHAAPRTLVLDPAWPVSATDGVRELAIALAEADADAVILVGPVSDLALQAAIIGGASAGASVYAVRRAAMRELNEPSFTLRHSEQLALLTRPALVGSQLVLKRTVDFVGALVGLVVLSPVFVLTAIAIRLTSAGPVFFRQRRVGLGGDVFEIVKFRTMVVDAERQQAELAASNVYAADPLFKMAADPRLSPIGAFLRRSSLDELPQLLNVLRGEMSLVGPRPALPSEVARYEQRHFVRFEVLPGMTGPWQVGGRNAIRDFDTVVQMEADYIRGWTVWRDFWILFRTVPAVLSMRGAF